MQASPLSPLTEYRARFERFSGAHAASDRRFHGLSNARLATGFVAVVIAGVAIGGGWISPWWLLVPLVVFIVLAIRHDGVARERAQQARGVDYYQKALGRLQHNWLGKGRTGEQFRTPDHLYADDLDVLGTGSLFELLSTARTVAGEQKLASWLLSAGLDDAYAGELRARQQAVQELAPKLDLREQMALLGEEVRSALGDDAMRAWGAREPVRFFAGARWVGLALGLAFLVTFVLFMAQLTPSLPLLIVILLEVVFGFLVRNGIAGIVAGASSFALELKLLGQLLARLEGEQFSSPRLQEIARGWALAQEDRRSAAGEIRRLSKWVDRLEWTRNPFFAIAALPLLWMPQCAFAIEIWRQRNGVAIGGWVSSVGEFEALCSLANFSYERPDAVFPELSAAAQGPIFRGIDVRHPLIDPAVAIPNNVVLSVLTGDASRLWVISGSNMSGKSTLLRAVGLNAVLAWAGAPVCCSQLQVSPLRIGASIRVNDSLADNKSRFYAEISRLSDIVALAKSGAPTLFLLDELLSGTNSHDRRIGAAAIVKSLVGLGAIGMVTTHDLALAKIADGLNARNVHFEDHLEAGEMHFDYRLKPGLVERSNALELMRAVGLDV